MVIKVDVDKFMELKGDFKNTSDKQVQDYINEILNIMESYEIFISYNDGYVRKCMELVSNNLENVSKNMVKNVFKGELIKFSKEINGINIKVMGILENRKIKIGELFINEDNSYSYRDLILSQISNVKAVSSTIKGEKENEQQIVWNVIVAGRILFDINNKITIQKKSSIEVKKTKKIKKSNQRKKENKIIIINKVCVHYTGEKAEVTRSNSIYTTAQWHSRGYWRFIKSTGEKKWIKGSIKKRKALLNYENDINVERKEYVYK